MWPDFGRVQRQHRFIGQLVGETAIWRMYVSANAGTPAAGVGPEPYYMDRLITGTFRAALFDEVQAAGGQFFAGDVIATLLDCQPGPRDEVQWSGTIYRIATDTTPQAIHNRQSWRMVLRRGDATG